MIRWRVVTDASPEVSDLPVTVVTSRDRDRQVWTSLQEDNADLKASVVPFFDNGETVGREDWYPRIS